MTGAVGVGGVPIAKGAETEVAAARGTAGAGVETVGPTPRKKPADWAKMTQRQRTRWTKVSWKTKGK